MELPKDIQNITLRYIYQSNFQFLKGFVDEYYVTDPYDPPEFNIDTPANNNKFKELLELNRLKSTINTRIEWDENDLIDLNIIKQFILFVLPLYFENRLNRDDYDYNNYIINNINKNLRKYKIPIIIVGSFSQTSEGDSVFYLYEVKDKGIEILKYV